MLPMAQEAPVFARLRGRHHPERTHRRRCCATESRVALHLLTELAELEIALLADPIHLGITGGDDLGGFQIGGGDQFGFLLLAGVDHIEHRGLTTDRLDGLGQHHDVLGRGTGCQGVDARLDRIDLGLELR